jgi:hypothetical protein
MRKATIEERIEEPRGGHMPPSLRSKPIQQLRASGPAFVLPLARTNRAGYPFSTRVQAAPPSVWPARSVVTQWLPFWSR